MPPSETRSIEAVLEAVHREAAARTRTRQRRGRLAATGSAALVLVLVVAGVVAVHGGAERHDDGRRVQAGSTTTSDPVATDPAGEWSAMADSPLSPRSKPITVWTGTEMLVWGGEGAWHPKRCTTLDNQTEQCGDPLRVDGAAYDPAADTWRMLPASPLPPDPGSIMWRYTGVWTGTELLVWGGPGPDAAAYDPVADRWRSIDPGPLGPRIRFAAAWTGTELVIYGGSGSEGPGGEPLGPDASVDGLFDDGARYNPQTDTWREVPSSGARQYGRPIGDPLVVWTGTEVMVLPVLDDLEGPDAGAAFDPAAGTWRPLPPFPIDLFAAQVTWTGEELVAVGVEHDADYTRYAWFARAYDPVADAWRSFPSASGPPASDRDAILNEALWTGEEVVVFGSGRARAYDPAHGGWPARAFDPTDGTWRTLPDDGLVARDASARVWTGSELLVWGGTTYGDLGDRRPVGDGARYRPGSR